MSDHDSVRIDPERQELAVWLRAAVEAANGRAQRNWLGWPPDGGNRWLEEWSAAPEGWQQWNGAAGGKACSVVVLGWWSDAAGRKHCRVVGVRGEFRKAERVNLLCPPGEQAPPLALVYPDVVFHRRGGQSEWLVWCACGALGRPNELGWMGASCGPCHDRREEGQEPRRLWPDPARGTWHSPQDLIAVAFAPDRALVLEGYRQGAVLESTTDGGWQRVWAQAVGEPVWRAAALHPDGRSVLSLTAEGLGCRRRSRAPRRGARDDRLAPRPGDGCGVLPGRAHGGQPGRRGGQALAG
jgi:hypothetical protein